METQTLALRWCLTTHTAVLIIILCCRTIYEKLANAFTEEQAVLYNQRVEEISPNIRYCAYNIGKERYLMSNKEQGLFTEEEYWLDS